MTVGNKIEVVDPSEAEEADYYVCIPLTNPLTFPDNMIDTCCKCGKAIQHRPHYPVGVRKICMSCIDISNEDTMQITPETAKEVAEYLHKKTAN
jgi:hypothetical protein